eukprot:scaffold267280_cov30-Tisochrysis_lutea.AAC.10
MTAADCTVPPSVGSNENISMRPHAAMFDSRRQSTCATATGDVPPNASAKGLLADFDPIAAKSVQLHAPSGSLVTSPMLSNESACDNFSLTPVTWVPPRLTTASRSSPPTSSTM